MPKKPTTDDPPAAGPTPPRQFRLGDETLADLDLNVVRAGSGFEALRCLLDADYSAEAAPPLQPGETVLLLTDGIVEAHGSDEDLFGTERVLQLVKAHRHRPAREILNTKPGDGLHPVPFLR